MSLINHGWSHPAGLDVAVDAKMCSDGLEAIISHLRRGRRHKNYQVSWYHTTCYPLTPGAGGEACVAVRKRLDWENPRHIARIRSTFNHLRFGLLASSGPQHQGTTQED
jgi:hypothetical protein